MDTRKYESPLGGDISLNKATKGRGWKGLKGQMALALAVSLWIGSSGVAMAAEVIVQDGESIDYISCSGDGNTVIVESGGQVTGALYGDGITGGVKNNQITMAGTVENRINGGCSSYGEVTGNQVTISGLAKDYVKGGWAQLADAKDNHVTLLASGTVKYSIYGGDAGGDAEKNTVTIKGGGSRRRR